MIKRIALLGILVAIATSCTVPSENVLSENVAYLDSTIVFCNSFIGNRAVAFKTKDFDHLRTILKKADKINRYSMRHAKYAFQIPIDTINDIEVSYYFYHGFNNQKKSELILKDIYYDHYKIVKVQLDKGQKFEYYMTKYMSEHANRQKEKAEQLKAIQKYVVDNRIN